jgi:hypothetical protein
METIIQSGRSVIMLSPNGKTLVRKASPVAAGWASVQT